MSSIKNILSNSYQRKSIYNFNIYKDLAKSNAKLTAHINLKSHDSTNIKYELHMKHFTLINSALCTFYIY